jgi:hypothetical protein
MRRKITTVYLVLCDGDDDHCIMSGPRSWFGTLRDLGVRSGWWMAIDEYGRRIASVKPVDDWTVGPVVLDRDYAPVADEAGAAAALALAERCSTARRSIMAVSDFPVRIIARWRKILAEKGKPVPPWKVRAEP